MPKVSEEHRAQRREAILDAALRCIREKGFAATSMADIIRASGLSTGAVYGYFASKAEIASAVTQRVFAAEAPTASTNAMQKGSAPVHPVDFIARHIQNIEKTLGSLGILVQVWGRAVTEPEMTGVMAQAREMGHARLDEVVRDWIAYVHDNDSARVDELTRAWEPLVIGLFAEIVIAEGVLGSEMRDEYLSAARVAMDAAWRSVPE